MESREGMHGSSLYSLLSVPANPKLFKETNSIGFFLKCQIKISEL